MRGSLAVVKKGFSHFGQLSLFMFDTSRGKQSPAIRSREKKQPIYYSAGQAVSTTLREGIYPLKTGHFIAVSLDFSGSLW